MFLEEERFPEGDGAPLPLEALPEGGVAGLEGTCGEDGGARGDGGGTARGEGSTPEARVEDEAMAVGGRRRRPQRRRLISPSTAVEDFLASSPLLSPVSSKGGRHLFSGEKLSSPTSSPPQGGDPQRNQQTIARATTGRGPAAHDAVLRNNEDDTSMRLMNQNPLMDQNALNPDGSIPARSLGLSDSAIAALAQIGAVRPASNGEPALHLAVNSDGHLLVRLPAGDGAADPTPIFPLGGARAGDEEPTTTPVFEQSPR